VDKVSFSTVTYHILLGTKAMEGHGWMGGNSESEVLQVLSTPLRASHPQAGIVAIHDPLDDKMPNAQQPKSFSFEPFGRCKWEDLALA
jgi:hypothetical protein